MYQVEKSLLAVMIWRIVCTQFTDSVSWGRVITKFLWFFF